MKLWGGRFETGPSEVFERFSGSLAFRPAADRRRHSRARRRSRGRWSGSAILSAAERAQIVEAFEAIREEAPRPASSRARRTRTSTRWSSAS